jgi:hypothetical protein
MVIFIEITENRIKYGLVSAMTETSLSMYKQTVGELKVEYAKQQLLTLEILDENSRISGF